MARLIIIYFLITSITSSIDSARILAIWPFPSISHQVVFRSLTEELVKRGHEMVVITTDPAYSKGEAPANLREIDVHDISYNIFRELVVSTAKRKKDETVEQLHDVLEILTTLVEVQLLTNEVQSLIREKKHFDLVLIESLVKPALYLTHVFKAPVILVSSLGPIIGDYSLMGAPSHPLLCPLYNQHKLYNLTMWEKINSLHLHFSLHYLYWQYTKKEHNIFKNHLGSDLPTLKVLRDNVHMIILNIHQIWEGNSPVPPGVVHMGGVPIKPIKPIPTDLKSYLDSSKNGVIYISFGTNVMPSLLPPEKIQMLVKVFSQLPYDVLWKWDKDVLPGKTPNIKTFKWLPQSDLLRHPKIKLFITQGGLQSTDEAITAGVPLVGVPMLGDQWYNVEKYVHHGIGVGLDMETLTEEAFMNAITTVINDESYRRNVRKLHAIIQDQPQKPLDRAVWWTEYVIRHKGAKHLRSPAANISWSEYLELELVSVVLLCFLTALTVVIYAFISIARYVRRNYCGNVKLKDN